MHSQACSGIVRNQTTKTGGAGVGSCLQKPSMPGQKARFDLVDLPGKVLEQTEAKLACLFQQHSKARIKHEKVKEETWKEENEFMM